MRLLFFERVSMDDESWKMYMKNRIRKAISFRNHLRNAENLTT